MELPVLVKWVLYKNDGGFGVLSCELDRFSSKYKLEMEDLVKDYINPKYGSFIVTIGMLDPNEDTKGGQYIFVGSFASDKKYGNQFKAEFYYQDAPTTEDGLKIFLMTLPNIKASRSEAIIKAFGVEGTVFVLDNDINRLMEIAGINEKRIPAIKKAWDEKKFLRELYEFFNLHNINLSLADKVYKEWGRGSLKIMKENPYRLVEIRGIGFLTADDIAHKICQKIPDNERVKACIHYVLSDSLNKQSNLCMPYVNLKKVVVGTLFDCDQSLGKEVDSQIYLKLIPDCLKSNLHMFTLVKDLETNEGFVYLSFVWEKEYYIAKSLWDRKLFNHAKKDCNDNEIGVEEAKLEKYSGKPVKLDDSQKMAIKSAFTHKISVITGPGGSGKSTICRCICSLATNKGLKIRLMSPTGKAAQVLKDKTGYDASTVHRSLKMTPDEEYPREDISQDILLVDEISMAGLDTMFAITAAMEDNLWGNIVFIGDKNQLPSVSAGNFLSDIIDSGCANVVTLDKIHRTDDKSYISLLANDVSIGKTVEIPADAEDIKWHSLRTDTFHEELLSFIDQYLADGKGIEDLQIISPMKKGECGVYKINEVIQKKMSTINHTEENIIQIGFNKFHIGDRVIQIENNYEKMVFNGDMGLIKELGEKVIDPSVSDKQDKYLLVDFYGDKITYYGKELEQLQLGWCLTVHKMQGSSSKNIIFVMANEAQIMMSKEILYTALTRAEKKIDIFGNEGMWRLAPTRSSIRKRQTNFVKIIRGFKENRNILQLLKKEK